MEYAYVDKPEALHATVEVLVEETLLGVDTEAAGYHRYHDSISLVQISSRSANYLIDPIELPDLSALRPLFENGSIEKIFHDADFDLRILDRDLGLHVDGLFDTQIAAAFIGIRSLGLGAILKSVLEVDIPKAYQRADWAERPLSEGMKEYAASDTAYLPELRDRLREKLEELGRLGWAEEEFRRRETTRWSEPDDAIEAFMRIKGARDLTPRGLAILREMHAWREGVGEERDHATFRVLSNQAMIEIGLKAPTSAGDLRKVTGVSAGLADRRGRDMLAAVERGLAVPENEIPAYPPSRRWERDPEAEARSERLRQVRNRVAGELDLDPGFLISRAVLDEVARQNPASATDLEAVPDIRAWQVEAIGEQLIHALKA